ncbi:MAG TPA: hypothetical protein VNW71_03850 [Thermoanaerobaculia bacterium]|nr:hypothetical protein [Thermoanaerobaculia bacterium]
MAAAPSSKRSMEASVAKSAPLIKTTLIVASSGPDDSRFKDTELTPGPARRNLVPSNSYVLGWVVAFGATGTARLKVRIIFADGTTQDQNLSVQGNLGDPPAQRVVLIP